MNIVYSSIIMMTTSSRFLANQRGEDSGVFFSFSFRVLKKIKLKKMKWRKIRRPFPQLHTGTQRSNTWYVQTNETERNAAISYVKMVPRSWKIKKTASDLCVEACAEMTARASLHTAYTDADFLFFFFVLSFVEITADRLYRSGSEQVQSTFNLTDGRLIKSIQIAVAPSNSYNRV